MTDLITIDEYKTFASIEGKKTDPQIAALIKSCSRIVQDFIGYSLEGTTGQTKSYIRAIPGSQTYMLPGFDLMIDEVRYVRSGQDEAAGRLLSLAEFEVSETGRFDLYNIVPKQGDMFVITHRMPATDLESIKLATMMLVKYYYKEEFNKTAMGAGGQTISYQTGKNFPPQVRAILMMYRMF
ncbi:hypothetical protein AEO54_305 [Vibrio phage vB_VorS-PVo5]|nr:hypothetical protein AEO54_305 [Vibrio phage vB_VorS-PVo5]